MIKEVRIEGLDELKAGLERVGRTLTDDELRDSLMDAAVPLETLAEAKAPRRANGSQQGHTHIGRFPDPDEPAVEVGVTRDAFWLMFQELGTGPRTRRSGGSTGALPSRPWLRPAADESESEVGKTFGRVHGRKIEIAGRG